VGEANLERLSTDDRFGGESLDMQSGRSDPVELASDVGSSPGGPQK
jgi:hypothetical protein